MLFGRFFPAMCYYPIQASVVKRSYSGVATGSVVRGKLSGKVAVATGSTEGIGFAIAKRLAQDGATVVVSSRNEDKVERAVKDLTSDGLDAIGIVCHVGKQEDRKRLVDLAIQKKGAIDFFISNAGVNPEHGMVLDTSDEVWEKIFHVNVTAPFLLTKAVVPHMEKRGGGAIIYVSSTLGYNPIRAVGAYSVSKSTLFSLTKAVAIQLGPKNVRANCLCPGLINTRFSKVIRESDVFMQQFNLSTPLQRIGEPEECAGLASFLCSEDASYITGETFVLSGGMHTRL